MRRVSFARTAATAGVLLGLFACTPYGANVGVGVSYVNRGPPRNRYEIRGSPPGAGYVWVGGYYRWAGNDYDWVPGRWEAVAVGHRSYSPGRWRHSRQGWYWSEGRWH